MKPIKVYGTSELLNALINQGLQKRHFNEFMYSLYSNFTNSVETAKGQWQIKGMKGKIQMVCTIRAVKQ